MSDEKALRKISKMQNNDYFGNDYSARKILVESIRCFHDDYFIATIVLGTSLIESMANKFINKKVSEEKKGDLNDFKKKLIYLKDENHINEDLHKRLDKIRRSRNLILHEYNAETINDSKTLEENIDIMLKDNNEAFETLKLVRKVYKKLIKTL